MGIKINPELDKKLIESIEKGEHVMTEQYIELQDYFQKRNSILDAEKRHNDIVNIQKNQMKILEQQNRFTKVLAIGTVILAVISFFNFFGLTFPSELSWEPGTYLLGICLVFLFAFGLIILLIALFYLIIESFAIFYNKNLF